MNNDIITTSNGISPSDFNIDSLDQIPTAEDVAGKNPPFMNLKDHPELSGQNVIILNADVRNGVLPSGELTEYAQCEAFVFPDSVKLSNDNKKDYACVISSGSDNYMQRVKSALENSGFPFRGKLRNVGRAWFID